MFRRTLLKLLPASLVPTLTVTPEVVGATPCGRTADDDVDAMLADLAPSLRTAWDVCPGLPMVVNCHRFRELRTEALAPGVSYRHAVRVTTPRIQFDVDADVAHQRPVAYPMPAGGALPTLCDYAALANDDQRGRILGPAFWTPYVAALAEACHRAPSNFGDRARLVAVERLGVWTGRVGFMAELLLYTLALIEVSRRDTDAAS